MSIPTYRIIPSSTPRNVTPRRSGPANKTKLYVHITQFPPLLNYIRLWIAEIQPKSKWWLISIFLLFLLILFLRGSSLRRRKNLGKWSLELGVYTFPSLEQNKKWTNPSSSSFLLVKCRFVAFVVVVVVVGQNDCVYGLSTMYGQSFVVIRRLSLLRAVKLLRVGGRGNFYSCSSKNLNAELYFYFHFS